MNRTPDAIPELRGFLEPTDDRRTFRCSSCGQLWYEDREPFMHADVPVVFKVWADPDGTLNPVRYDLMQRRFVRR